MHAEEVNASAYVRFVTSWKTPTDHTVQCILRQKNYGKL